MKDLIYLIKIAGLKMIPFFQAVAIYFIFVNIEAKGEYWTTILKCAPIFGLMFFTKLHKINSAKEQIYSRHILIGLICSCIGDILLNHNLFPHGMGAFGIAHIFYISAFGFKPFKLWIGLLLYTFGGLFVALIFNSLDRILIYGLPIYAILLTTMCWRALARNNSTNNDETTLTLTNSMCALGSLLFVISDGFIAINRFYMKIPNAGIYIMSTYYAAQFGITLSIVKKPKSELFSKKKSTKSQTAQSDVEELKKIK